MDEKEKYRGDFRENIAETMIRENKKRAKFFLKDKDAQQLTPESTDMVRCINILLDGQGRIFSRSK